LVENSRGLILSFCFLVLRLWEAISIFRRGTIPLPSRRHLQCRGIGGDGMGSKR
jgi:hypothetical protein